MLPLLSVARKKTNVLAEASTLFISLWKSFVGTMCQKMTQEQKGMEVKNRSQGFITQKTPGQTIKNRTQCLKKTFIEKKRQTRCLKQ